MFLALRLSRYYVLSGVTQRHVKPELKIVTGRGYVSAPRQSSIDRPR